MTNLLLRCPGQLAKVEVLANLIERTLQVVAYAAGRQGGTPSAHYQLRPIVHRDLPIIRRIHTPHYVVHFEYVMLESRSDLNLGRECNNKRNTIKHTAKSIPPSPTVLSSSPCKLYLSEK
jgi:hypothetical protein